MLLGQEISLLARPNQSVGSANRTLHSPAPVPQRYNAWQASQETCHMTTASKLLSNAQAAERIGVQPNTLEIWRTRGKGPQFIKLDPNSLRSPIRYRESDIETWLEVRTCTNTSQYPAQQQAVA